MHHFSLPAALITLGLFLFWFLLLVLLSGRRYRLGYQEGVADAQRAARRQERTAYRPGRVNAGRHAATEIMPAVKP